ncbi:MAG: phosphate-starvation-inducible PsiE family protein [Clostridia bacterium]|nr:phosphate-starvation-inducible PsiE family protein [Clostridia bacterium]
MKEKIQKKMYELSYLAEIIISVVIYAIIAIGIAKIVIDMLNPDISWYREDALNYFLNRALSLAVATELIKMLCRHTASSVIEVLLFATARQMVVEHYSPVQTLISVVAIACLFATRKYLLSRSDTEDLDN